MAISTYLSIISLNVNYLILQSKDIEWINRLKKKKKQDPYMLPTRDSLQMSGHTQPESEKMKKDIL